MSVTRENNPLPGIPLIESPFFKEFFTAALKKKDKQLYDIAFQLNEKGYAVLKFPDKDFNKRAERIKEDLLPLYDWKSYREDNKRGLRIQDAWKTQEDVKSLACNSRILDLLAKLYGRAPIPFQTLNFPVGTQQHYHSDSVHFSCIPERFMCGVWIALEDIDDESGPLEYYPSTHKWPIYTNEHIGRSINTGEKVSQVIYQNAWKELVEQSKIQKETFKAKKGDALIWCANLLHGGAPQIDISKTRWSQVTHYYFENCSYYTPMLSEPFKGLIAYREITDINTGKKVENKCNNVIVDVNFIKQSQIGHSTQPIPQNEFNATQYVVDNPDVKDIDPYTHYIKFGFYEKRKAMSILDKPLIPENDFNAEQYVIDNPDIELEKAYKHYSTHGIQEKRKAFSISGNFGPLPKNKFDSKAYLAANKDVKEAGVDPYEHYVNSGFYEKRPLTL